MESNERTVGEYKVRRIGNSNVITIPQSLDFHAGETVILKANEAGTKVSFEKKVSSNPWENGAFDDIDFQKDMQLVGNFGKGKDIGKEKVDW